MASYRRTDASSPWESAWEWTYLGIEDGPRECKILVWDTTSGKKFADLPGHKRQIQQVQFEDDATELRSVDEDEVVRRWTLRSGEFFEGESANLNTGQPRRGWPLILPGGTRAAIRELQSISRGKSRGRISIAEIGNKEPLWENIHDDRWPAGFAISPDGKILAAFQRALSQSRVSDRVILLSAEDGREVLQFDLEDGSVRSLAFSRDGKLLFTGMDAGDTLVWDISKAHVPEVSAGQELDGLLNRSLVVKER